MFEEQSIQAVSAGFADTWSNVSTDTESRTALRVRFWCVSCFDIFQPSCYTRSPRQKFTVRISSNGHWGLSWSAFVLHCQWVCSWLCTVCRAAFVSLVLGMSTADAATWRCSSLCTPHASLTRRLVFVFFKHASLDESLRSALWRNLGCMRVGQQVLRAD